MSAGGGGGLKTWTSARHTAREADAVAIDLHSIYDRVAAAKVVQKPTLWAEPLFDVVRRRCREGVLSRVCTACAHTLLVVRQRRVRLAQTKVPKLDLRVLRARDDLRLDALGQDARHRVRVAS